MAIIPALPGHRNLLPTEKETTPQNRKAPRLANIFKSSPRRTFRSSPERKGDATGQTPLHRGSFPGAVGSTRLQQHDETVGSSQPSRKLRPDHVGRCLGKTAAPRESGPGSTPAPSGWPRSPGSPAAPPGPCSGVKAQLSLQGQGLQLSFEV